MKASAVQPGQQRFGAHMSIAGGLHLAFERAREVGCDSLQVFVKNQRQWKAKPLTDAEVTAWRSAWKQSGIRHVVAHDTYLINLAAPNETNLAKSIDAFTYELERCEQLGIPYLVTHPGAHCGLGEQEGLRRVARSLDTVHRRTRGFRVQTLLEVTAGQGSSLGYRFEHLGEIIRRTQEHDRLGICLDTCHAFAAGYDLTTPGSYRATMQQVEDCVGLARLRCFHMNDSKTTAGSRVDRHEAIGRGCLGRGAFRHLVNDPRFLGIPMILETPKGQDERGRDWDRVNLATLRRLLEGAGRRSPAR